MREKELRLALVCFGGVSLAVYMHGVSKEILKLVRASRALHAIRDRAARASARPEDSIPPDDPEYDTEGVYFELLREIGRHVELRVIVDVIAGASAGGINGVMLARALAHDLPVAHLRDMWLESGDVAALLAESRRARRWSKPFMSPFVWALGRSDYAGGVRDPEVRQKLSLFVRSRWFKPPLDGPKMSALMFTAIDRMGEPADPARSLLPIGLALDLFVTITDYYGYQRLVRIHDPAVIREREHRHVLHFGYRRFRTSEVQSDFLRDNAAALAFAARATSAYPGAFPPAQIRETDAMLAALGRGWPRRAEFITSQFRDYHQAGLDPEATSFIDGSVLNNKPFAEALHALRTRPAYRQVDRRLVYIDPDPVQPSPPPSGRTPGFFATLKGALSDLPRNEPIAEQLASISTFNERVRKLRAIVDSARPEIARLVTEIPEARVDGSSSPAEIRAWREAANEHAARNAGFAYQGYVRRKLDAVQTFVARALGSICGVRDGSAEARALEAIVSAWARRRGIVYQDDPANRSAGRSHDGSGPAWIEFLHAFDVEFRRRRLVFLIQGQNRLYAMHADDAGGETRQRIDELKRAFYISLERLRRYDDPHFYSRVTCAELQALFSRGLAPEQAAALEDHAEDFAAANEAALARLVERLAAEIDLASATDELDMLLAGTARAEWPASVRRDVLVNYVGFPFWDVLTLGVTSWRDLGEFDEIRVDRISPEDAPTLARLKNGPALRGTAFLHFGAFFSRAFRENDYLLGRLQSIDRIIDIVCDSAGAEAVAAIDVAALKRRAFDVVLCAEEPHLSRVSALIERLRAELVDRLDGGRARAGTE
ncbi:MAG TPA: patatin-like protein [Gammaproteobacteria bacterium]|nr:patatin-like protein [Gammaproteobacteria bacterium]